MGFPLLEFPLSVQVSAHVVTFEFRDRSLSPRLCTLSHLSPACLKASSWTLPSSLPSSLTTGFSTSTIPLLAFPPLSQLPWLSTRSPGQTPSRGFLIYAITCLRLMLVVCGYAKLQLPAFLSTEVSRICLAHTRLQAGTFTLQHTGFLFRGWSDNLFPVSCDMVTQRSGSH